MDSDRECWQCQQYVKAIDYIFDMLIAEMGDTEACNLLWRAYSEAKKDEK